jgi:glycosyltransferase involved in cell wall biosynthesis
MRIAVVSSEGGVVGGREAYLGRVLPRLAARGHRLALAFVHAAAPGRLALAETVPDAPVWYLESQGGEAVLDRLRAWNPDLLFMHGTGEEVEWERRLLKTFPAVLLAHSYYGTCISGSKTTSFPLRTPCGRRFGPMCLVQYFPRRCGGLHPRTMWRLYRREQVRRELLTEYRAVLTLSQHMRREYLQHGLTPERVICLPPLVEEGSGQTPERTRPWGQQGWRLLFLGRMDRLKGGDLLLQALPRVRREVGQPIHLDLGGEGPQRQAWQRLAQRVQRHEGITVAFHGWLTADQRDALLRQADLLVVPSVWPEPFGLVGLEAGRLGVPAVAFAVGGIPEWLHDGVTGKLAPAQPPSVAGLASAIAECLRDRVVHQRLAQGAMEFARRHTLDRHLDALEAALAKVLGQSSNLP